jgi:hypothetical protein
VRDRGQSEEAAGFGEILKAFVGALIARHKCASKDKSVTLAILEDILCRLDLQLMNFMLLCGVS